MSDETHQHPNYEEEDVNPGFIVVLFGAIVILVAVALVAMGGLVQVFDAFEEPPMIEEARLPRSGARLQSNPGQDWTVYRSTQEALLSSAGWVDQEMSRARIPIDAAIATVAADGALPEFAAEATAEITPEATDATTGDNSS